MSTLDEDQAKEVLREQPSAFVEHILGVEPFDYQKEFLDDPADRKCFVAGRQVGKSRVASWMALHHALTHPHSTTLITADALRQSSELFNQILSEIEQADGVADWGIERQTQTIIEFDNGSRIICVPTGRSGNKIRGYTAEMIIVDEAAFIDDQIFEDTLEPMLFATDGTMVLLSTPYGKSGYFYEKADDPSSAFSTTHATSYDNPAIDDEKIEQFKEGKTQVTIDQEVYGKFSENANAFFPTSLVKSVTSTHVDCEGSKLYLGVDIARHGTDQTAIALIDDEGNVFKVDDFDDSAITESVESIKQLDAHYDFEKILVDETGIGAGPVEILQTEIGHKVDGVKMTLQKKQSIYQTAKAEMEDGAVTLPADKTLKEQLESMGVDETKNNNLSIHARDGGRDDYVDAVCLAIWASDASDRRGKNTGAKIPFNLGSLRGS